MNWDSILNSFKDPKLKKFEQDLAHQLFQFYGEERFKNQPEVIAPSFQKFQKKIDQLGIKVITVGGTNGKGETCHLLHQAFNRAGLHGALFTSPHILSVRERFIKNADFIEGVELYNLIEHHQGELKEKELSFFEFLFFLFLEWSLENQSSMPLDYLILEVGMGGRLDAVNLLNADIAVITSIGLDHQAYLGATCEDILAEKIEITRAQKYLVSGVVDVSLRPLIHAFCQIRRVNLVDCAENEHFRTASYPQRNEQVATQVLALSAELFWRDRFKLSPQVISLPAECLGRRQILTLADKKFIFIGAHNTQGIEQMIDWLKGDTSPLTMIDEIWMGFSDRAVSDVQTMIDLLMGINEVKEKKIFSFGHTKAFKIDQLLAWIKNRWATLKIQSLESETIDTRGIEAQKFFHGRGKDCFADEKKNFILVTGSYYFVGEVQKKLLSSSPVHSAGPHPHL
jgi:dihydrofolate synthase/folylpolyglutamate synthase